MENSPVKKNLRPKKALGQNFLTSLPAREAIISAASLHKGELVLEIGPGKGFLTAGILASGSQLVAVEKDTELIGYLSEHFSSKIKDGQLTLYEGDALTLEPPHLLYKLVANIPYYITGAILERFLSHERKPSLMVVLVQKEVAERIVARDGKESILSLAVKAYGKPRIAHRVSAGSFFPKPKVDSAVLAIEGISGSHFVSEDHELIYFTILKRGFLHKRKMLFSNLKELFGEEVLAPLFDRLDIDRKERAENVKLETWLNLSLELSRLA